MTRKKGYMPGASGFSGRVSPVALLLRSLALFGILYQARLFARDMADTPVFVIAIAIALALPWLLDRTRLKPLATIAILLVLPWAFRFCIAVPRYIIPSRFRSIAIGLDSLLLNYDRNAFVYLLPWYWAAFSTVAARRSRLFLRADALISLWILLAFFSVAKTADMEAYRWPILMIGLFALICFLLLLALMLSLPPSYLVRKREKVTAAVLLFLLVLLGGLALIQPSQERAIEQGGGLLQPNLFQFDFSQILRLESEIRMNDDLVLIVRKDPEDAHIFLRRFVLSGYSLRQGFYRHEALDEASHPQRLPDVRTPLHPPEISSYQETSQDYYLVNFDSSAFIGMNTPVEIIPYDNWDASSFNSAYGVTSYTSEAYHFELIDAVPSISPVQLQGSGAFRRESLGPGALQLSAEEYALYTEYGGNEKIAAFAREATQGLTSYWEIVQALYERFRYGEFRYSLKPGIASDGDQLGHFLFQSKRGYCSYFAFAMTLALRSLGIPARVAVGFFIDPRQNTFDYYPVRADMAHAWVEVYYPYYGWIEYDPTTDQLAEDEEFRFSSGVPQDLFERLMREILENRHRLNPREGEAAKTPGISLQSLRNSAERFLRQWGLLLLLLALAALFIGLRCWHYLAALAARNPRKKALRLWAHTQQRLRFGGIKRGSMMGEGEWAKALDATLALGAYPLYLGAAAARYAPEFAQPDWTEMWARYGCFSAQYRRQISAFRRIGAWLCPPLARLIAKRLLPLALIILFLATPRSSAQGQESPEIEWTADSLYRAATRAQEAENWEQAISLYSQGIRSYPLDERFPWALGSLYYSRRLYSLAWDEYRRMEQLLPEDPALLYRLSRTAGYLNQDALSAQYLERLLVIDRDNREAIGNLGWMYYKLHRLEEGEALLQASLTRLGPDPDFSMTLGTLYSDMFRYNEAKSWYLDAIAAGERLGDRIFAAVAHYNLSILESRFYYYADAFARTGASLASQNRASGRLSRGELYLRRLDLSRAFNEFLTAYDIDTSPLSKVNLAQAYQIAGRLEEARLYAEDCLRLGDLSWMLNYGIDLDRYKRDLHEILYKTYQGLAKTERWLLYETWIQQVRSRFRQGYYQYKYISHRHLYRKYSLLAGSAYRANSPGEEGLDAQLQYYNAFEPYPQRALEYLRSARNFETPLIPQAEATYEAEEGQLLKNKAMVQSAIPDFDPLWERDLIADAYASLARMGGVGREERQDAAERLYALNTGALRQQGIRLPVELHLEIAPPRTERAVRNALRAMGLELSMPDRAAETLGPRFRLTIQAMDGNAQCALYDAGRGMVMFSTRIPLASHSRRDISRFSRELGDLLFVGGRE